MNRTYIIGALFLVVILGALIAFGSVSLIPGSVPDQPVPTQAQASQMPPQVVTIKGSIGDRVEGEGVALTVTGIEWKNSKTTSGQTPGNQSFLVHFVVENTNSSFDLQVAAGDFEIRRTNGALVDFTPEIVASDQLVDATLAPGEKATKTVVFDLPASDETLHLLYDYNDQHIDVDLGQ